MKTLVSMFFALRRWLSVGALISLSSPAMVLAADWASYRGPLHSGVSPEASLTPTWGDAGPKTAWRTNVGIGVSSVAVVGARAVTMGNRADTDVVTCFNVDDGRVLWTATYACPFEERQFEGGTASTPAIDGDRVYTLSHTGLLHCYQLADGKLAWSRNLVADFGGRLARWKYSGSPVILDDRLIVDTGSADKSTVALSKLTGETIWAVGDDSAGYATPVPFRQGDTDAVLVFKGKAMVAHALADGRQLWRLPWKTSYDVNASSPTVVGDKVLISSGYNDGRAVLLQLTAGEPEPLWRNDDVKTKMSSCVVRDDHAYAITERGGRLLCVALADGKTVWEQKGVGRFGTLIGAGEKLVVLTDDGTLIIADASPEGYVEHARSKILEGRCWVTPVIANGRIYCRNNTGELVCLDVR